MRALILFFLIFAVLFPSGSRAIFANESKISELKKNIEKKNRELNNLEKEIEEFQEKIEEKAAEAQTLKGEISRISLIINKLNKDINLTEGRIETTSLILERLSLEIMKTKKEIESRKMAMAEFLRQIYDADSLSLVEILLSQGSISNFFDDIEQIKNVQENMRITLADLKNLRDNLEKEEKEKQKSRNDLISLQNRLEDQRIIQQRIKNNKNYLLKITKNKEAEYKKLLNERLAKKEALEAEIKSIEEELRIIIDPSSLPSPGSGVLAWPLDAVKITQYFGKTPFATKNPQVYNGIGHNGIDLRAGVGTPVKSAKEGVVAGTGDTDRNCKGVSYGKWILIKHPNNLSTLYAHLSLIKVKSGEMVNKGDIIGYSGNTGYTTGPHLHFGVYASRAVKISQIKSRICGTNMTLPIAPYNGYLNPLSYL